MVYRIELTPRAERDLLALPPATSRRLIPRIDALARVPRPRGCKKLEGQDNVYRLRLGDYRVLYQIRDKVLLVLVIAVRHRSDAYRHRP